MNNEFILALEALEKSKNISKDVLIEAIEAAIAAAYKKNYVASADSDLEVKIDGETGEISIYNKKTIVDNVCFPEKEVSLEYARSLDPRYDLNDTIRFIIETTPKSFSRIAAQTAKQVVVQKIRETERGMVYDDYIQRQGQIINGVVHRKSGDTLFIDMGQTDGILTPNEQVPGETYDVNDRLKLYIMDVKKMPKGPQIFLSRSHPGLVKGLFELEVPEIEDGIVEIKGIAREAGSRSKIAVYTEDENIDPVGACVGQKGTRVEAIVDELNGEKIDIIPWSEDPVELITNVLSPAKVDEVMVDEELKSAIAIVPDYQLSLAIGKEGQNVRLAARVSGWKIDIKSVSQYYNLNEEDEEEPLEDIIEDVEGDIVELE